MSIQKGDRIPDVTLTIMGEDGPEPFSTSEIIRDKKVVLFAVPGAFTPTCSAKHLPGFVEQASELKGKGVDTVACMAVNDVFVMDAWGKDQGTGDNVMMLADGNGEYAQALGLEMDGTAFGMGMRGQRFALVVDDGVATHVAVEEPGQFEVSKVESVLAALDA